MNNKNITFGMYVSKLRNDAGLSLREFAKQLGISAPYLSDIEKQKRDAAFGDDDVSKHLKEANDQMEPLKLLDD